MRSARFVVFVGMLITLAGTQTRSRAAQRAADPTAPQLLAAAGRYVAGYESSFGAIVAEERCLQFTNGADTTTNRVANRASRRVTSGDVLLFNSGGAGWMAFRDAHVVDNVELPVAKGRLAAVAVNPTREALADVMGATEANEQYAIGTMARAPAIPTAALMYLRALQQPFGVFEFEGMKSVDGIRAAVLKFSQRPHARTTDADDFTITGRFWIEPETGRVVQTVLTITSDEYENNVEVQYASRPGIDVWVPIRMLESYTATVPLLGALGSRAGGGATRAYADALSTFQAFQRFDLKPGLVIK